MRVLYYTGLSPCVVDYAPSELFCESLTFSLEVKSILILKFFNISVCVHDLVFLLNDLKYLKNKTFTKIIAPFYIIFPLFSTFLLTAKV